VFNSQNFLKKVLNFSFQTNVLKRVVWTNHQIYEYPRDGNIQPNRKGEANNFSMFVDIVAQSIIEGDKNQRKHGSSQHNMADEYDEVDRSNHPLSAIGLVGHEVVINKI